MPAQIWKARAEKARVAADKLSDRDARVARRFAIECDYRVSCLSEVRPSPEECDNCSFLEFGKCD
jgi:hypothetical protein